MIGNHSMLEPLKIALGTAVTAAAVEYSWTGPANDLMTLLMTTGGVVVAWLTAWYTWERAMEIQKRRYDEKKKGEQKDDTD